MKKIFLTGALFLGMTFGSFVTIDSLSNSKVEALGDVPFCTAVNATYGDPVTNGLTLNCVPSNTTIVFNYTYKFNVTGFSSGADGY